MKILGEKTLLTLPVPSILKQLFEIKNDKFLFSHFFVLCGTSRRDHLFEAPEKKCENKKYFIFPPYSRLGQEG